MEKELQAHLSSHWEWLLTASQPLSFQKGQTLFYSGHKPYGLYIVKSAKVRFEPGGLPCSGHHVWKSPKGDVLGAEPFFEDKPFCCSCVAQEDCEILFLPKSQLERFFPEGEKS